MRGLILFLLSLISLYSYSQCSVNIAANSSPSCAGTYDGYVFIIPSGLSPFTFTFNNDTANIIVGNSLAKANLCAGYYPIEIVDDTGCIVQDTIEIVDPEPLFASISVVQHPSGPNACDGSVGIDSASGIGGSSSIEWYNCVDSTFMFGPFALSPCFSPGQYYMSITNVNGCIFFTNCVELISTVGAKENVEDIITTAIINGQLNFSSKVHSVLIYNISGQMIFEEQGHIQSLNLKQFKTGYYILSFSGLDGTQQSKKIFIN